MNFTREPIIETIITPREGYRLLLRGTKGTSPEEYYVEAVEVVSFGTSIFYRSLEKPRAFLLPVGDYEILEAKDTKVTLKAASVDRSIKIGNKEPISPPAEEKNSLQEGKKHNRRKSKKRKNHGQSERGPSHPSQNKEGQTKEDVLKETLEAPPVFSKLFPPPTTLIKDSLSKQREAEILQANLLPEKIEEEEPNLPEPKEETRELELPMEEAPQEPEVLEDPIFNPDDVGIRDSVKEGHPSER